MNDTQTNSGAAAGMIRIERTHLSELEDEFRIDDLDTLARFAGGDYALKYIPPKLHLFRVSEQVIL